MRRRSKTTISGQKSRTANTAKNSAKVLKRGEVPLGRTIEEALEEYSPPAQALKDARSREVLKLLDLEKDLQELRTPLETAKPEPRRRRRTPDERKVFIARMTARGMDGPQIWRAFDAQSRKGLEPREEWIRRSGSRLWTELWHCKDPKVRAAVKAYYHAAPAFRASC
jgi:hypothetical protein